MEFGKAGKKWLLVLVLVAVLLVGGFFLLKGRDNINCSPPSNYKSYIDTRAIGVGDILQLNIEKASPSSKLVYAFCFSKYSSGVSSDYRVVKLVPATTTLYSFNFTETGNYVVKLINMSSKKALDTLIIETTLRPVAFFEKINNCYPYMNCGLDASASKDPDGKIVLYKWYVGDNKVMETTTSDAAVILTPGSGVTMSLVVVDDKGVNSSYTRKLEAGLMEEIQIPDPAKLGKSQQEIIKSLCKAEVKLPKAPSKKYYTGYLNDMHAHIWAKEDPYNYTIALLATANAVGVKRLAISQYGAGVEGDREFERNKDKAILEIAKLCPERFDAMLSAVYPDDPSSVEYVRKNLEDPVWKGIGEIYIKNSYHGNFSANISNYANAPTMMAIYRILAEKNKPIHFHLDTPKQADLDALGQAVQENPQTTFVWAHCPIPGLDLVKKYKNLYCENEFYYSSSEHPAIFNLASDIIMGTDSSVFADITKGIQNYYFLVENTRTVFGVLYSKEEADAMGRENYEKLLH